MCVCHRRKRHMGTKREVKKACRSVSSQWHHSGDATGNTERELKTEKDHRSQKRERKRERARASERWAPKDR